MKTEQESEENDFIVRVRGLPWSAKEAEIKEFFSGINLKVFFFFDNVLRLNFPVFVACEDIKSIHFTYTREGRPTGEAYIECGNSQDVAMALLKHRENMKDRYIEG